MHGIPPSNQLTPPDYETAEQAEWQANATTAQTNSNMVSAQRIKTYEWKFGYPKNAIIAKIQTDPMFAATFAKNPVNESFEKTVAHDWLKLNLNVQIVDKFHKGAPNSLYVTTNGDVTTFAGNLKPSKALNFRWQINGITYYALHKYSPSSGGSQRKQFEAEQEILTNFQQATDQNTVLIVIVDGDYYDNIKMNTLRSLTNSNRPKSFAVHMEDVPWAILQCP